MEQLTFGEIAMGLTFIVGFIGSVTYLKKHAKDWLGESLKDSFDNISKRLDTVQSRVDAIDKNTCKNFLVRCLDDLDNGTLLDDVCLQRFWEQYEHYVEIGGNTYIQRKVEQLKEAGKL